MPEPSTGILVLGYTRPRLLEQVLESLLRQEVTGLVHVWIDGTASRMEMRAEPAACLKVARRYPVAEIRPHNGHLGIEKLMLDALVEMKNRYERLIVLEDDCFPTRRALKVFAAALDRVEADPTLFSTYGHPFLTPTEGETSTRFQGWGWATTRHRLTPILDQARQLFLLSEQAYLEFTHRSLTPGIMARLDITPGRDVCQVLREFFSWDSCTALLAALAGQSHLRTPERVVYNCGMGGGSGHFPDEERFRRPPFNMIRPEEVWDVF